MIKPIKMTNVNFTSNEQASDTLKQNQKIGNTNNFAAFTTSNSTNKTDSYETQNAEQTEQKEKKTIGEKLHDTKLGLMNLAKGFNNVKDTALGFTRGVVDGAIGFAAVGVIGKNLAENDGNFFRSLVGVAKDVGSGALTVVKNIPKVFTTKPTEAVVSAFKGVKEIAKENLKGKPAVVAAATVTGLGILAFRTIQGKVIANQRNANLDHSLNEGHIPTK